MPAKPRAALQLPTGTVTFLFTDIEGSTRLWETQRGAMQQALAHHTGPGIDVNELSLAVVDITYPSA